MNNNQKQAPSLAFPLITKSKFCQILNNLRDKEDGYCEVSDQLTDLIGMTVDLIPTVNFIEDIIYLLEVSTGVAFLGNSSSHSEPFIVTERSVIEYFVYDLHYGRDYTPQSFLDEHDNPINISTPETLYDYIVTTVASLPYPAPLDKGSSGPGAGNNIINNNNSTGGTE